MNRILYAFVSLFLIITSCDLNKEGEKIVVETQALPLVGIDFPTDWITKRTIQVEGRLQNIQTSELPGASNNKDYDFTQFSIGAVYGNNLYVAYFDFENPEVADYETRYPFRLAVIPDGSSTASSEVQLEPSVAARTGGFIAFDGGRIAYIGTPPIGTTGDKFELSYRNFLKEQVAKKHQDLPTVPTEWRIKEELYSSNSEKKRSSMSAVLTIADADGDNKKRTLLLGYVDEKYTISSTDSHSWFQQQKGRLAYDPTSGRIIAFMGKNGEGGNVVHQMGYTSVFDPKLGEDTIESMTTKFNVGSHSFGQRIALSPDGSYAILGIGDSYPRSVYGRIANIQGSSYAVEKFTAYETPGKQGNNVTHTSLGDIRRVGNYYAAVYTNGNGRQGRDIRLTMIDKAGNVVGDTYLTHYISTPATQIGDYQDIASNIMCETIDDTRLLVTWKHDKKKTKQVETYPYFAIVNVGDPKNIHFDYDPTKIETAQSLHGYSMFKYGDGNIGWVVGNNNDLEIYTFNKTALSD